MFKYLQQKVKEQKFKYNTTSIIRTNWDQR